MADLSYPRVATLHSISFWCNSGWKRAFDSVAACILLAMLSPLLVLLAVIVKMTSKGPVLFRQSRQGRHGREFHILKFRTMVFNRQQTGPLVTRAGDPRVTWLGKLLRKWKLDELPQLFNILRGEMSFVGPRPQATQLWLEPTIQGLVAGVLSVRPGITSYATLNFRNEEELLAPLTADELEEIWRKVILPVKLRMDLDYLHIATFVSDVSLIFKTTLRILNPQRLSSNPFVNQHLAAVRPKKYRTAAGNAD